MFCGQSVFPSMVSVCSFSACCWKSFGINCSWEGHALPNRFRELWFSFQLAGGFTALVSDLKNAEREREKNKKKRKKKKPGLFGSVRCHQMGERLDFSPCSNPLPLPSSPCCHPPHLGAFWRAGHGCPGVGLLGWWKLLSTLERKKLKEERKKYHQMRQLS